MNAQCTRSLIPFCLELNIGKFPPISKCDCPGFHRLARARAAARPHERQTGAATPQRDIQPRKPGVKLAPAARLARDRNDLVAMLKAVAPERLPPCPRLEVTRRSRRPAALPLVIRHAEIGRQTEPTLKRPTGPLKRPVIPPRRVNLPRHGMHPVTGDVHVEVVGVAMRRRNAPMLPEAERPGERAFRLPKVRAVKDFPGAHDTMRRYARFAPAGLRDRTASTSAVAASRSDASLPASQPTIHRSTGLSPESRAPATYAASARKLSRTSGAFATFFAIMTASATAKPAAGPHTVRDRWRPP